MPEFASLRLPSTVAPDPKDALVVVPLAPLAALAAPVLRAWPRGGLVRVCNLAPGDLWFRVPPRFFKGRRHPRPKPMVVGRRDLVVAALAVTDPAETAALRDYWAESRLTGPSELVWPGHSFDMTVYASNGLVYASILGDRVEVSVPRWRPD